MENETVIDTSVFKENKKTIENEKVSYDDFFEKTKEEYKISDDDLIFRITELVDKGYIEDTFNVFNKIAVTIKTGFLLESELLYEYMEQESDESVGVFNFKVGLAQAAMSIVSYNGEELEAIKTLEELNDRAFWVEQNIPLAIHSQIHYKINRLKKINSLLGHEKINDLLGK